MRLRLQKAAICSWSMASWEGMAASPLTMML
jgi:hypothetical protein